MSEKQRLQIEGTVKIGGTDYTLLHPGNIAWLEKKSEFIEARPNGGAGMNLGKLIPWFFKTCVTGPAKPDIEAIHPKEVDEWAIAALKFLHGELENTEEVVVDTDGSRGYERRPLVAPVQSGAARRGRGRPKKA